MCITLQAAGAETGAAHRQPRADRRQTGSARCSRGQPTGAGECIALSLDRACDGQEALVCVRDASPQAIDLDLMMPVMDGWTFLGSCRAGDSCAGVPIVVVSA